jgi:hypothetical protein
MASSAAKSTTKSAASSAASSVAPEATTAAAGVAQTKFSKADLMTFATSGATRVYYMSALDDDKTYTFAEAEAAVKKYKGGLF